MKIVSKAFFPIDSLEADLVASSPNSKKPFTHQSMQVKTGNKATVAKKKQRGRTKKWTKPEGKPNRPLSAYNLFFRHERAVILGSDAPSPAMEERKKRSHCKTHGKIGFSEMAKTIGARWKALDAATKREYENQAQDERERYGMKLGIWKSSQEQKSDIQEEISVPKSLMISQEYLVSATKQNSMQAPPSPCPSEYLGSVQRKHQDDQHQRYWNTLESHETFLLSSPCPSARVGSYPGTEDISASRIIFQKFLMKQWQQQQDDLVRLTVASAEIERLRSLSELQSKLAFFEACL